MKLQQPLQKIHQKPAEPARRPFYKGTGPAIFCFPIPAPTATPGSRFAPTATFRSPIAPSAVPGSRLTAPDNSGSQPEPSATPNPRIPASDAPTFRPASAALRARAALVLAFLFTILLLSTTGLKAQDPGFSQFFASPLTLNPALTGKFNGVVRVAGNYRNQWPSINNAFITSTISVDAPILRGKLPENDTWGLGIMGMNDKTAGGALNSNYFSLSTAYHKALDEDGYHQLGVGFQGTYANRTLDGTQLHFEDQLNLNGTWDPISPSETNISGRYVSVHYFDVNLGVLYNASTDGNNNYYFGASAYHLNHPKQSFLGVDTVNVPTRITLHGGGYFPIQGSPSTIYVSALFNNQAGAREYVAGGAWAVNASNDETAPVNFYAGVWGRFTNNTTDAVIPYVGLDYSDFSLGVTYDVNVSSLKTASQSRGGIEISLIYIKKSSSGRKAVPCPKF